ncbi:MAG: ATPase [Haloplasmataceae bacterium]|jgi:AAA+ ATPase superfamily predicted ATPase|nr:ATPase [Haloplasmataceae bacterium]
MNFIDRVNELKYLNDEYEKDTSSLIIVYGRRRIGKTALLREFGKDKLMLYYFITEESEYQVMKKFKEIVADFTKNELLKVAQVNDWEIIFKQFVEYHTDQKKLLVLDEFQYLGKTKPEFISIFQKIWDTMLKDKNIMVILCGSLVHMMAEQTLSYSSPLYGRRTGQMKLKQIKFKDYQLFFTNKDRKTLIEYYAVTGGVPKYIEFFKEEIDVYEAIRKSVLNPQTFLYEEPLFLLQNEVKEIGSYFSLIKSIASGNCKLCNISASLGLEQTRLTKYLQTLSNLDIIEREVPITDPNPEKSKKGLYFIKDNFIEFWFKFVYPYKNYLELDNKEYVLTKIKDYFISNHVSFVYEKVCMETMWDMNENKIFGFHFNRLGRWWDKDNEIDLVAYDANGRDIIFGECKYTNKPIDTDVFSSICEKAKTVEWNNENRKEHYILFCISGFTQPMIDLAKMREDIVLIDY